MGVGRGSMLAVAALTALGVFAAWWFIAHGANDVIDATLKSDIDSHAPKLSGGALPIENEVARTPSAAEEKPATEDTSKAALPPAMREVRLQVLDQDLRPLEGTRVECIEGLAPGVLLTDAKGECRLHADPSAFHLRLEVAHEGFMHQRGLQVNQPDLRVILRRMVLLSGSVLDAQTHAPVPDARLLFPHANCTGCPPTVVTTNLDGAFEATGVPFDQSAVRIQAKDYPTYSSTLRLEGAIESAHHDFLIPRGVAIRGRVVDFTSGAGLPDARVSAGTGWVTDTSFAVDARGEFEGRAVQDAEGNVPMRIECKNRCLLLVRLSREELAASEMLELRLPESPIVEGSVLDESGAPVVGAGVVVMPDSRAENEAKAARASPPPSPLSTLPKSWKFQDSGHSLSPSDSAGAFRIMGLVPWSPYHYIAAQAQGFRSKEFKLDSLPGPSESRHVDLRIEHLPFQRGAVVFGHVWLNGVFLPNVVDWSSTAGSGKKESEYGAEYRIEQVPAGTLRLHASVHGISAAIEGDTVSLELHEGEALRHDFELRAPSGTIRGTVNFIGGSPAAGARIAAFQFKPGGTNLWRIARDVAAAADGSFMLELPELEQGYHISASVGAAYASRDDVRLGTEDLRIELAASGKLALRAVDSVTREPIDPKSWMVLAQQAGDGEFREPNWNLAGAGKDGWISLEFREGPLELMLRPRRGEYQVARAKARVLANEESRLEVVMQPGLRVQFRLDPAPDASWDERRVFVVEPENWSAIRFWTEPDGNGHREAGPSFPGNTIYERGLRFDSAGVAQLNCLGAGNYRFKVTPDELGVAIDPPSIDLTADTTEPIVLRWKP